MTDLIMDLCRSMGADDSQRALLRPLTQAAQHSLIENLRPGTELSDCGPAFPLAVAMLAMDALKEATGEKGVEAFTAGTLTIRRSGNQQSLSQQARRLMAPWLRDKNFMFRGVNG